VIHTHSKTALMVTLLYPGKEFSCTHLEMIKVLFIYCVKLSKKKKIYKEDFVGNL
jgi:hypothetical protein